MKLDRLPFFVAVVDTGSFTRAAAQMGVTKAVVSAHVARLEEELGTALLLRSTRKVTPTPEGLLLHDRARIILREAAEAREALLSSGDMPTGLLRVTAPLDYGQSVLMPLVARFRALYPACRVALDLNDRVVDLQDGQWDLSVRLGWLTDSSLKTRRLGAFRQYLVIAPEALAAKPVPRLPEDLPALPFVANSALPSPGTWELTGPEGLSRRVRLDPAVTMTTTPAVLSGVLAGVGCAILPHFLVSAPLAEGRLIRLLPDWQLKEGGIHLVYPPTRFRLPKVAAFTELLVQSHRNAPKG